VAEAVERLERTRRAPPAAAPKPEPEGREADF
jgi:hypothetical protein